MGNNIVLIGFMATGKTAVGKALAKKLKFKYVSTDDIVEKLAKMKIPEIFEKYGERRFRELETKVLASLKKRKNSVISCGGGIVLKPGNICKIKKLGTVFLLKASAKSIDSRLGNLKNRPLLNIRDSRKRIAEIRKILKIRASFYLNAADHTVRTDTVPLNVVAGRICSKIKTSLHSGE